MSLGLLYDKKKPIERNGIESTQVKSIKILTELDDGAANDNSGTIKPKAGIVFGKTYRFKVEDYTNEEPVDKNLIKWGVSYMDTETKMYYKNTLEDFIIGDTISITFKNQNMCGHNMEVKAYINDFENEGKLSLFKHNRFRFFDREILKKEIQARMFTGDKIDQGESSMCAIALIGHFFAIQKPLEYEKMILDMHRKGNAIITSTQYNINLDNDDHLVEIKDSDSKYPKESYPKTTNMSFADFVFQFSIKDYLNNVFDYDPDGPDSGGIIEGGTGLTLPNEVEAMMKNILAYTDIKDETNLATSKWSSTKSSAEELLDLLKTGYSIGLLINVDNFKHNKKSIFSTPNHWVGLRGISLDESNEEISVNVFTWGNINKTWVMSFAVFKDGYFGYVAGK